MKRALIFLAAAPVLVGASVLLTFVAMNKDELAEPLAAILFLFTVPVSAVAGGLDTWLARAFPILLRAPMIASAGAIGASGLAFILFRCFFAPDTLPLPYFALGGATCMGVCSLLANDYAGTSLTGIVGNSLLRDG